MDIKPRKNDPLRPVARIVTDQVRVRELTSAFKRKLNYIRQSYEMAMELYGNEPSFNNSLEELRRYDRGGREGSKPSLHPELAIAVSYCARKIAEERGSPEGITDADREAGEREALRRLKPLRGRPKNYLLHHHVEGLMALILETTGTAVHATKNKKYAYDPQASDRVSAMVVNFFRQVDPMATDTQIVDIIISARRKWRGKPMRFLEFFPFYGATITPH